MEVLRQAAVFPKSDAAASCQDGNIRAAGCASFKPIISAGNYIEKLLFIVYNTVKIQ